METPEERQKWAGWCRTHHDMIKDGGNWGVPRSGLIFKKTQEGFELIDVAPYLPEISEGFEEGMDVPCSPSALREYQKADFECIKRHNEAAGLKITDPNNLLCQ